MSKGPCCDYWRSWDCKQQKRGSMHSVADKASKENCAAGWVANADDRIASQETRRGVKGNDTVLTTLLDNSLASYQGGHRLPGWWQISKGSGCEWARPVRDWSHWRLDALGRVLCQLWPVGGTTSVAPARPYWRQKSSGFVRAVSASTGTCRFCAAQPESPGSCFAKGCPVACGEWPTSPPPQSVGTPGRPLSRLRPGSGRLERS